MSPYFNKNNTENNLLTDIIITKRYPIKIESKFEKGEIVLLKHPFENRLTLKILVGISGDWIKQIDTEIYHKIPEGYCWVEDYKNLDDSNNWGPVKLSNQR